MSHDSPEHFTASNVTRVGGHFLENAQVASTRKLAWPSWWVASLDMPENLMGRERERACVKVREWVVQHMYV